MLELFYTRPRCRDRLRHGPLSPHLDDFAKMLSEARYSTTRAWQLIQTASRLSRFAASKGISSADGIDDVLICKFDSQLDMGYRRADLSCVVKRLRKARIIPPSHTKESHPLLCRYESHLIDVRGLAPTTCCRYRRTAEKFLVWWDKKGRSKSFSKLCGVHVLKYVSERLPEHPSFSSKGSLCSRTRLFLRFLYNERVIDKDLSQIVPKVHSRQLATIPRHLPWSEVGKLIDNADTSTAIGLRDKAVILLLARLGLRSAEICALELKHIDWRQRTILVAKTKTRRERVLPLPDDVGSALGDYLLKARPDVKDPHVFMRHRAPIRPLGTNGAVMRIVDRQLRLAGVSGPSRGPHMLRHSLATHLVNSGVSLKTIADILGHVDLDSTAIYAKVDIAHLSGVALPFPGGSR